MTADLVPTAWLMHYPGCDGSADWVELGAVAPVDIDDYIASPLYTKADIDAAISADRARAARICQAAGVVAGCASSGAVAAAAKAMAKHCAGLIMGTKEGADV